MRDEIVVTPKENGSMGVEVKAPEGEVKTYLPLQGFLEIDSTDKETSDKLKDVWDYFNKDGKKSNAEILYEIRSQENKMGGIGLNETRLGKIYQYVKIRKDIETNEKLLNEL